MDIKKIEWQLVPNAGMINRIGWRVGGAMRYPRGHLWQGNVEVGRRPGPTLYFGLKGNGIYLDLGLGCSIGFGKYNMAYKKKNTREAERK